MKRFLSVLVVFAFLPFASGLVWIQPSRLTPVVTGSDTPWISAQTLGSLRSDFTGGVGVKFTVNSDFTMTHLGRWKVSGNSGSHAVTLYSNAGSVLATTTISMSGGTAGTYVYGTITPVALTNGSSYWIISDETSGGDQWYDEIGTFADTFSSVATLTHSAYRDSGTNSTSTAATPYRLYGPVNFKY